MTLSRTSPLTSRAEASRSRTAGEREMDVLSVFGMLSRAKAWPLFNCILADVTPVMPRVERTQITVELAPVTKRALEEIVRGGEYLSVLDFVRRAVDEKLDRWKKEHPLGVSTARGR